MDTTFHLEQLQSLSPYAEGEWMRNSKTRAPNSEGGDQAKTDPIPDRILRGPIWNYGSTSNNDYYTDLLFGRKRHLLLSQEEKILKGPSWSPTQHVSKSFAQYLLSRINEADPASTALVEVETGRSLTYGQLSRQVVCLATGLRHIGVLPGQVFSVLSFNSLEAEAIVMAVLMVGGVVCAIDPALNAVDLGANLRLVEPHWVFSESGKTLRKLETALGYLMTPRPPTLVVNCHPPHATYHNFSDLLLEYDPEFKPQFEIYDAENPVFLMFTSGTTGVNKASLVSERYFMRSRMFLESVFVAPGPTYTTLLSNPFFWISIMATFLVHISGGHRVVLFRGHPTEMTLIAALRKYNVMMWVTPPSTLMHLLHWPVRLRCPSLKVIVPVGMPFRREHIMKVLNEVFERKTAICQVYGMTEMGLVSGNTPFVNKLGSVGKPFVNVHMKVVERGTGVCLGPNDEGELCFKTPSMMLCYYNNPTETANMFDEDGFIHTGDIGYYDDEGFIFITGRIKELIRWRNNVILPGEVELRLIIQPEVREAVVFGLYNEEDGEDVTAAIVPKPGYEEIDPTIIQARINELLSETRKIRGGVHVFSTFPIGSTGKPNKVLIMGEVIHRKNSLQLGNISA